MNGRNRWLMVTTIALLLAAPAAAGAQTLTRHDIVRAEHSRAFAQKLVSIRDLTLQRELIAHAKVTVTATATAANYSGCWGQNTDKHNVQVFGVTVAWEKLIVGGFCWRGSGLTSWGGDGSQRGNIAAYCWTNTNGPDEWWFHRPTWRRASVSGDVGGNAIWGCVSLQHDNDWMGYGLNNGHPQWIKH